MGKKQHSKDRLFITATEWKYAYGGHKDIKDARYRALPFDRCALSLQPFDHPVCTIQGHIFDLVHIVPYLKEHKKNPIDGSPLSSKDLFKLNFHKNVKGEYICPLTYKVFNNNTHIVAIKTSGQVYCFEAIDQLNIKAKHWEDLISGEKFTRADIITIQDPHNYSNREIDQFVYIQEKKQKEEKQLDTVSTIAPTSSSSSAIVAATTTSSSLSPATISAPPGLKRAASTDTNSNESNKKARLSQDNHDDKKQEPVKSAPRSRHTSHLVTASFTSTNFTPHTKNERAVLTDEQIREQWYTHMKTKVGKKAFVRIVTNKGFINLQLHCDLVPRTCHNFLTLCKNKYYNNTIFHRLIPGFMIQGGDPTGTGRGGQSAWGALPFKDEIISELKHDQRGILSMANSGPNTNKSQFFITFGACEWLNGKHTIFGSLVGGLPVLEALEKIPTFQKDVDKKDRPREEIKIEEIKIYENPFDEPFEAKDELDIDAEKQQNTDYWRAYARGDKIVKETPEEDRRAWFSNPTPHLEPVSSTSTGIGKYIKRDETSTTTLNLPPADSKKNKGKGDFNFSSW